MQTNKTIPPNSELYAKGQALMVAAHDYWKSYQKECGSCAVVWVDNTNGHFVLFTRGEYKSTLIRGIDMINGEPPLERPFEVPPIACTSMFPRQDEPIARAAIDDAHQILDTVLPRRDITHLGLCARIRQLIEALQRKQ